MDVNEFISVNLMKFMAGKWPKCIYASNEYYMQRTTDNGIRYELICHTLYANTAVFKHASTAILIFSLLVSELRIAMLWLYRAKQSRAERTWLALKMIHYLFNCLIRDTFPYFNKSNLNLILNCVYIIHIQCTVMLYDFIIIINMMVVMVVVTMMVVVMVMQR